MLFPAILVTDNCRLEAGLTFLPVLKVSELPDAGAGSSSRGKPGLWRTLADPHCQQPGPWGCARPGFLVTLGNAAHSALQRGTTVSRDARVWCLEVMEGEPGSCPVHLWTGCLTAEAEEPRATAGGAAPTQELGTGQRVTLLWPECVHHRGGPGLSVSVAAASGSESKAERMTFYFVLLGYFSGSLSRNLGLIFQSYFWPVCPRMLPAASWARSGAVCFPVPGADLLCHRLLVLQGGLGTSTLQLLCRSSI